MKCREANKSCHPDGWPAARHNLKLKKKKRQDYINGERLQHLLGWKGSSDFGPKPQASSSKRQASSTKELDSHKIPDIK